MKRACTLSVGAALAGLWLGGCAHGAHDGHEGHDEAHVHWGYDGGEQPSAWGSLSPEYERCARGRAQSPVALDVARMESSALSPLVVHYRPTHATEENNGHTIQDVLDPGDYLELDGARFELKSFHFHHPSEHTLNGKRYPLEVHLVHRSAAGALLVVGVLVTEGAEHPLLRVLFDHLPRGEEKQHFTVDPAALLPTRSPYILYEGSLTTPPCTEGVTWIVLAEPLSASPDQIHRFAALFPHNNRPVMPLNGRHLRAVEGR